MKTPNTCWTRIACIVSILALFKLPVMGEEPAMPHQVAFELGRAQFASGDSITLRRLHGTRSTIEVGGTYCVEGSYTLASHDGATLAFYATTVGPSGWTTTDPSQVVQIKKGTGSFRLVKTLREDGYLHVSLYPLPSGNSFGGVYFGQRNRVYRPSDSGLSVGESGPNQVLFQYLGNPVKPPSNMDARYSVEGLTQAINQSALHARIPLRKVVVDNSEFPFLVGVLCPDADFPHLKKELNALDGYKYGGSVGGDSCYAFNIVPASAYAPEEVLPILHRTTLRMSVLYDKLKAQDKP